MIWHSDSTAAVVTELQTDRVRGLSADEATARQRAYGENRPSRPKKQPFFRRLFARLKRPSVVLLLIAAAVSLGVALHHRFTGDLSINWWEPAILLVLALLRCLVSVLCEPHTDAVLASLNSLTAPSARVVRDGEESSISGADLVPGDVIAVTAGDLIPADCRLLECAELLCDESVLTGDALAAEKDAAAIVPSIAPLNERGNMLYAGTTVLRGTARAVVTEIGERTELGKATALQIAEPHARLPMLPEIGRLSHALSLPLFLLAAVVFVLALLVADLPVLSALLLALALAVTVMPEELPAFVAAVFASGVRRMAALGAVVRRPAAAEALGRATVLCTDKTATLTENHMTLVRAFVGDHMVKLDENRMPADVNTLIQLATLCTAREGNPTDTAITAYARLQGMERDELILTYPRLGDIPFDATRRRMTTVHLVEGRNVVIVKGAPEEVLPLCGNVPDAAADAEEFMGAGALRVLAVAYKYIDDVPAHCFADELECGLTFLGLLGLSDPVREEAIDAVAECQSAGIRPVVLTGDNQTAATAFARRLGLLQSGEEATLGNTLTTMSDAELAQNAADLHVCARVSAKDTARLVSAWKKAGATVALTGDCLADVPALRAADIGCAMKRDGDDAACESADVVFTDDRFATLVAAVRESRTMVDNLRRTLQYWIARHVGELVLLAAALIGLGVSPLSPALLLWIGVIAGALPMWALSAEPAGRHVMRRAPRQKYDGMFSFGGGIAALALGLLLGALAFVALLIGNEAGVSMATAVLGFGELSLMLCLRSPLPLWKSRPLHALRTWLALLLGVGLLLPLWLVPVVRDVCGLAALAAAQWRTVALFSLLPLIVAEVVKIVMLLRDRGNRA